MEKADHTGRPEENEVADYEQLYRQLHAYHFGAIGFLELLERFEQILHIHSPPGSQDMVDIIGS